MRFLPDLASGTSMKSRLVRAVAAEDHALLVAGEVGVALDVDVVEHPFHHSERAYASLQSMVVWDTRAVMRRHPCHARPGESHRVARRETPGCRPRAGSDDDRGADAVGEDLRWVRQRPGVTGRLTVGRPGDRARVEHVVGGVPAALQHRRPGDPGRGERLEPWRLPLGGALRGSTAPDIVANDTSGCTSTTSTVGRVASQASTSRILSRNAKAWAPTPCPLSPRLTASASLHGRRRGRPGGSGS